MAIDGVYTLILERTNHASPTLTVPLQIPVGYEYHWPLLLLSDLRAAEVAEEGYLYAGNYGAAFAIRHLARSVRQLECSIRAALFLREGARFSLTLPDMGNSPVSGMVVIKSLVKQLVEDKCGVVARGLGGGGENYVPTTTAESPSRASLLGLGIYRLRVTHDPADVMQFGDFVARVRIHSRPRPGATAASAKNNTRDKDPPSPPQLVHFPVTPNILAAKVGQMVQDLVDTTADVGGAGGASAGGAGGSGTGAGGNAGAGGNGGWRMRLLHEDTEIPYANGVTLGESMFRLNHGETRGLGIGIRYIDLEVRWE